MKVAIYPGSFDPLHIGHINIIEKAAKLFDQLYVVISLNPNKQADVTFSNRQKFVINKLKHLPNVQVMINQHMLTVDMAHSLHANYLVRGLRSNVDFDYELNYFDGTKALDAQMEIVYFISDDEKRNISSSMLKEIAHFKKGT